MKKPSRKYLKYKERLEAQESKLKEDFLTVTEEFETHAKKIGLAVLISGVVITVCYGLYRSFYPPKKADTPQVKLPKKKSFFTPKNILFEKLVESIIKYLIAQFKETMNDSKKKN